MGKPTLDDYMEWTRDEEAFQTEKWTKFQDMCYQQVDKDIAVLCPESDASLGIQEMTAAVLASIPNDPSRFETMYVVLKIVEDKKFWEDICTAYQSGKATSPHVPFTDEETLRCHAIAVERIYKKHGFDKIEDFLV